MKAACCAAGAPCAPAAAKAAARGTVAAAEAADTAGAAAAATEATAGAAAALSLAAPAEEGGCGFTASLAGNCGAPSMLGATLAAAPAGATAALAGAVLTLTRVALTVAALAGGGSGGNSVCASRFLSGRMGVNTGSTNPSARAAAGNGDRACSSPAFPPRDVRVGAPGTVAAPAAAAGGASAAAKDGGSGDMAAGVRAAEAPSNSGFAPPVALLTVPPMTPPAAPPANRGSTTGCSRSAASAVIASAVRGVAAPARGDSRRASGDIMGVNALRGPRCGVCMAPAAMMAAAAAADGVNAALPAAGGAGGGGGGGRARMAVSVARRAAGPCMTDCRARSG